MIRSFFEDKFEYDFRCNQQWIILLEEQEDQLNDYLKKSISHILNVHHIWLCRLTGKAAESELFDILPISHWQLFAQQNYLETLEFLKDLDESAAVNYLDSNNEGMTKNVIAILYHILNHSTHHRAQISRELRTLGIEPPSFNFISYH